MHKFEVYVYNKENSSFWSDPAKFGSISIHQNLKQISSSNFRGIQVQTVYLNGCQDFQLDGDSVSGLENIYYDSFETFYRVARKEAAHHIFVAGEEIVDLVVTDGVTEICDHLCDGCTSLRSVQLPSTITKIGVHAFANCINLMTINLPEGLKEIGHGAFSHCALLTTINLPEGLTKIEDWAFGGCYKLTGIDLPSTLTSLGSAFKFTAIESISIPDGITYFNFENCYKLKNVKLPNNLTKIYQDAFRNCLSLTSIELPESLKVIEKDAFAYSGLEQITLPANLKEIEENILAGCRNLADVYSQITDPAQCNIKTLDSDKCHLRTPYPIDETYESIFGHLTAANGDMYQKATLHLPNIKGIASAYKKKAAWKKFANIVVE